MSISITIAAQGAIEAGGFGIANVVIAGDVYKLYIDGTLSATTTIGNINKVKGNKVSAAGARIVKLAMLNNATPRTITHVDYVFAGVNKV